MKTAEFKYRIGTLIEYHICDKYNLFHNNRQNISGKGYYDAYDKETIYEIKASTTNRVMIILKNHKLLVNANGKYIFVLYNLEDKDTELRLISDIKINQIIKMDSKKVDKLINNKKIEKYSNNDKNIYKRINISDIKRLE